MEQAKELVQQLVESNRNCLFIVDRCENFFSDSILLEHWLSVTSSNRIFLTNFRPKNKFLRKDFCVKSLKRCSIAIGLRSSLFLNIILKPSQGKSGRLKSLLNLRSQFPISCSKFDSQMRQSAKQNSLNNQFFFVLRLSLSPRSFVRLSKCQALSCRERGGGGGGRGS